MFNIGDYIKASRECARVEKENRRKWQIAYWMKALKKAGNYSNVALYGAGEHTRELLEYLSSDPGMEENVLEKIRCIIALERGRDIGKFPVITVEEAREKYNIDLIIISSSIYQNVIYDRLKSYSLPGIDLLKIYSDEDHVVPRERAYASYDEKNVLKSDIDFDHLQRYGWALGFVRGKVVVDMACGSGYGSGWMASVAEKVIGVDISEHAIAHANKTYGNTNCEFICENISNIELDLQADVVVSFETVEHIVDEDSYFAAIDRILKPGGILLISTPLAQSNGVSISNPYHTNE